MPGRRLPKRDREAARIAWLKGEIKRAKTPQQKVIKTADYVRAIMPGLAGSRSWKLADEISEDMVAATDRERRHAEGSAEHDHRSTE